jgi:hypothetical protein
MNSSLEFQRRMKELFALAEPEIETPKARYDEYEVPVGDLYAVYRRSNKGHNRIVMFNLPKQEADRWAEKMNLAEQEERSKYGLKKSEVFLFDSVLQDSPEESLYWNPSIVVTD